MKATTADLHTESGTRKVGLDENGDPLNNISVDINLTTNHAGDTIWKIIGFNLYRTTNAILSGHQIVVDVYDQDSTLIKSGLVITPSTTSLEFDSSGSLPGGDSKIESNTVIGTWTIEIDEAHSTIGNGEYWECGGGSVDEIYYGTPNLFSFTIERTEPMEITASAIRLASDPYTPVNHAEIWRREDGGEWAIIATNNFSENTLMYNITTSDTDIEYGVLYEYKTWISNTDGNWYSDILGKTIPQPNRYAFIM